MTLDRSGVTLDRKSMRTSVRVDPNVPELSRKQTSARAGTCRLMTQSGRYGDGHSGTMVQSNIGILSMSPRSVHDAPVVTLL